MTRAGRITVFLGVTAGMAASVLLLPRIPQDPHYHEFADQRSFLGVPRFTDVASNAAFAVAGLYGILAISRRKLRLIDPREASPFLVFFIGTLLIAFGSGYYHLHPDNSRLFWDRLPMSVAFMGLVSAVVADRISVRAGVRLLPFLVACGAASLVYWIASEGAGRGDLRPYIFVQFYSLIAILLLIWLFPARYSRTSDYPAALGFYTAARMFELADRPIFNLGHIVSGHTLKHVAAGVGCFWLARMLTRRQPLPASPCSLPSASHSEVLRAP